MDGDIKEHTHTKSKLFLYTTSIACIPKKKTLRSLPTPNQTPNERLIRVLEPLSRAKRPGNESNNPNPLTVWSLLVRPLFLFSLCSVRAVRCGSLFAVQLASHGVACFDVSSSSQCICI